MIEAIQPRTEAEAAEWEKNKVDMAEAQIPNEEELALEAQVFNSLGLDKMHQVELTLKNGTRIKYFPSADGSDRHMSIMGKGFDISIGRWRDLRSSSPWVLEGPYARYKELDENGREKMEYVGSLASPIIQGKFTELFPQNTTLAK